MLGDYRCRPSIGLHKHEITAILLFCLLMCSSVYADVIYGTLRADSISVSPSTSCEGVISFWGGDTVTVEENAFITKDTVDTGRLTVNSEATGIDTGLGDDHIVNNGTILINTTSVIPADPIANSATADSVGIVTWLGDDIVENNGLISVAASAEINMDGLSDDDSAFIGFVTDLLNTFSDGDENTIIDVTTATASGVVGIDGNHTIYNSGAINVQADAVQTAGSVINKATAESNGIITGSGDDTFINSGVILSQAAATIENTEITSDSRLAAIAVNTAAAEAAAAGIVSGAGADIITNSGTIQASASAGISPQGASSTVGFLSKAFGSATANADATGIDSGIGADAITSTGVINAVSEAVVMSQGADAAGILISDATDITVATTQSTGIDSGFGDDVITNDGNITARSTSTVSIQGVSAAGTGLAGSLGMSSAKATATGITGNSGNDTITSNGTITAVSTGILESSGLSGTVTGPAGSTILSSAKAESTGIDGGDGDDTISNTGDITANATAGAEAVAVSISGADVTSFIIPSGWDGVTTAKATAVGIDCGAGNDRIDNQGNISLNATAYTDSTSTAVTPIGAAIALSKSTAVAETTGIDLGNSDHDFSNTGNITAGSTAKAKAVSVSVSGAGAAVAGTTFWNGGAKADASSTGITANSGSGSITNTGDITLTSDADTDSDNVSVTILGIAASSSRSAASADATGIDAGLKDSAVTNTGDITTTSDANAESVGVSVSLAGAAISSGGIWNGGAQADAEATGIQAGTGNQDVVNSGIIDTNAHASTSSVNVSASVVGVAASLSTSNAAATATGIDTSLKTGNIINTGTIDSNATAQAEAVEVAVTGIGMAVSADAGVSADAQATGINAGYGKDVILNQETITADTTATTNAVKVSVSGLGDALTADSVLNGGTAADAVSTGIDAGWGDDDVTNEADITAIATADTGTVNVGATIIGISSTISSTTTTATAICIDAGLGDDTLTNSGHLTATADAAADSTQVNASAAGVSLSADAVWSGGTTAESTAKGISGGWGQDAIRNSGNIDVTAGSTASVTDVSLTGLGASTSLDFRNTATTAISHAAGIDGGEMADTIENSGIINATAISDVDGTNVALTLIGFSNTDSGTIGEAFSTGISGGSGGDTIINRNKITAVSNVSVDAVGVSGSIVGVSTANIGAEATAVARGIDGGECADLIQNTSDIDVAASSLADAAGVGVALAGGSGVNADIYSRTDATGIYGGDGNDTVTNTGNITAKTWNEANAVSVAVNLAGVSVSNADVTADISATGISGGDGDDEIDNSGQIDVKNASTADSTSVSVSLAGAGLSDAGVTADMTTTGISGDDGSDKINNSGDIYTTATSVTNAKSVSVTLAGYSGSDAGITTHVNAVGIDGGEGDDTIYNEGNIQATSITNTDATGVSVTLAGGSESNAEITAESYAVGIDGGNGEDDIENINSIIINAIAYADAESVDVTLAGGSSGTTGATARAHAVGIDGGDGDDTILNNGDIDITAISSTNADSTFVMLAGANTSDVTLAAEVTAAGIQGGSGNDTIDNTGDIIIRNYDTGNTSPGSLDSVSVNLAGATTRDTGIIVNTRAVGIDGGSDADTIRNTGSITVDIDTTLESDGTAVLVFGGSSSNAVIDTETAAGGIDGGEGNDFLDNGGTITVESDTTLGLSSDSFTFGGTASQQGTLLATSRSTGISGNDGSDYIRNYGTINATTNSTFSISGGTDIGFGSGSAGATAGTDALSTGIDGGEGDDVIDNKASIYVTSKATGSFGANSFTFGGTASNTGNLTILAQGAGISGGIGNDVIRNDGQLDVTVTSKLTSSGGSNVAFGNSGNAVKVSAETVATGITGGSGENTIENQGDLNVAAISSISLSGKTFAFGGTANNSGEAVSDATAFGIIGGDDADTVLNSGDITVESTAMTVASGITATAVGDNKASVTIESRSTAVGFDLGDGDNQVITEDQSNLNVTAYNLSLAGTSSEVGWFSNGRSISGSDTSSEAVGIRMGDGNNFIENNGSLRVSTENFFPFPIPFLIDSYAGAESYGDDLLDWVDGDAHGETTASTNAFAVGIQTGDGDNTISNTGLISITATPYAYAYSYADGDGFLGDADGTATAEATATAQVIGIDTGNGNNHITNTGTILLNASPKAEAVTSADGDGIDGNAHATSTVTCTARAVGIQTADGDNEILNQGTIDVTAVPTIEGDASASADWLIASATATEIFSISDTHAIGILTGNGNNIITNNNSITATCTAYGSILNTDAAGIQTGDGDDVITNNGNITVTCNTIAPFGITATGIETGDGDDVITNSGNISTEIDSLMYMFFPNKPGTAISSGSGNDQVILEDGSTVQGYIDLGTGNDTLTFHGSAGFDESTYQGYDIAYGNSGTDTLVFCGTGYNDAQFSSFERAVKQETGTYTVQNLPQQLQRIEVTQGTLSVEGNYQMSGTGTFQATINSATEYGQLDINGTAALDGDLNVTRETCAIPDGATFNILTANTVTGDFDTETLPDPTELVSFSLNQDADKVQVVASVDDFTTVAETPSDITIAAYLDALVPTATGDLSRAVGAVQMLDKSDFHTAFASLSPAAYNMSTITSFNNTRQYTRTVQNRMTAARAREKNSAYASLSGNDSALLAFNGKQTAQFADSRIERPTFNVWADGFGQFGSQNDLPGYSGYDYTMTGLAVGVDYSMVGFAMTDHFVTGLSIGYSGTDIESNDDLSESTIKHLSFSTYGSAEIGKLYFEGVLSYGRNAYDHERHIVIGTEVTDGTSSHDGNVYSATAACGYYLETGDWTFVPFTSLGFIAVDEAGFEVTGSGGYDLVCDGRRSDSLTMDMGLKTSRMVKAGRYILIPEVSLAWNYDFDIDDRTITARFKEAQGTSFSIEGPETPENGLITGAGIHIMSGGAITTSILYSGEFREDYSAHGIMGKVQYMFD